jgi:hypothetical protein
MMATIRWKWDFFHQERERELKSPLYKDAKEQYKSKQIVATATDLVTADLNLYYRTLDKCVYCASALSGSALHCRNLV